MADYRSLIVSTAAKYVGTKEPNGDDQFIKAYNKSVGTNFNMQTAWCAMFVTFCARMAGVPTTVIPNFASCTVSRDSFWKPKNRWRLRTSGYTPKPGDLIFFDWDLDGGPNHVGLVKSVTASQVTTIEGNTSDQTKVNKEDGVYVKTYSRSYKYILAYAEPAYPSTTVAPSATETKVSSLVKNTYIANYQKWLNENYGSTLTVDGEIGPMTKKASVVAWQKQMNSTYKAGLAVDGIFGAKCKTAANKFIIRKNSKGKLVYILQGVLYAHGYDPKGFDGTAGANTINALTAFQKARKLEVDGEAGPMTWESLFTKW
ncbi:MAG: peptidoglycan-binding protein [Muribaculaceae bacterium]|nr:peptidoglycan-binding protein [Muribaculaceae bacterium]